MKKIIILLFASVIVITASTYMIISANKMRREAQERGISGKSKTAPVAIESKDAPTVKESFSRLESGLENNQIYKECVARSVNTCGMDVIAEMSRNDQEDSACSVFGDRELRQACVNSVNESLARKKNDPSYCSRMDENRKSSCERSLIEERAIKAGDMNICKEINKLDQPEKKEIKEGELPTPPALMMDNLDYYQCQFHVIANKELTQDTIRLCDSINYEPLRDECISMTKIRSASIPQLP